MPLAFSGWAFGPQRIAPSPTPRQSGSTYTMLTSEGWAAEEPRVPPRDSPTRQGLLPPSPAPCSQPGEAERGESKATGLGHNTCQAEPGISEVLRLTFKIDVASEG